MRTIGIRTAPKELVFAIYCSEEEKILNIEKLSIPRALSTPEQLKFVRNTILDILDEYKVEKAGIRVTEPNAQRINVERVQIEGVVQEAFASSPLVSYFIGQVSNISAKVGIPRTDFKKVVSGEKVFERVENWNSLSSNEREAVLASLGAANV